MNTTALRWVGLALALVAAYFSNGLLGMHAVGSSDSGILAKICGEKAIECNKVVNSRWGVFPPGPAEKTDSAKNESAGGESAGTPEEEKAPRPDSSRKGIPVAALGLFYYIFIAVYLGLIGWPSWPCRAHDVRKGAASMRALTGESFFGVLEAG